MNTGPGYWVAVIGRTVSELTVRPQTWIGQWAKSRDRGCNPGTGWLFWLTSCRCLVSDPVSDQRPQYLIFQTGDHDGVGSQADKILSGSLTPMYSSLNLTADNQAVLPPNNNLELPLTSFPKSIWLQIRTSLLPLITLHSNKIFLADNHPPQFIFIFTYFLSTSIFFVCV